MLVVMLALGMTITTMAGAAGYSDAYDWIKDNMAAVFGWGSGSYDVDGITVIKGNETNRYESVEDFMKEENIDILYPSSLPEGVVLQTVVMTEYGDGKYAVIFQYNSNNISICIYNFDLYLSDIPEPNETIKIGEYEYTITYLSKNSYQANCIIDQYAYTIVSSDYNDLINIINSMKGKQLREAKEYEESFLEYLVVDDDDTEQFYEPTFEDVYQEYMSSHKREDIKESTVDTKRNIFEKHMSAKNKDDHNRLRYRTIGFRVSPEEDKINMIVSLTGMKKQDYIVAKLLDRTVIVHGNCKVHRAVYDRLTDVLTELRRVDTGGNIDDELRSDIELLAEIVNRLYVKNVI